MSTQPWGTWRRFAPAIAIAGVLTAGATEAAVIRIDEAAFVAGSGLITFSEFAVGTVNPTYAPADYGGGAGSPTVSFDGFFEGQSAGTTNPAACPAGAAVSGCVLGNPSSPLGLEPASPDTFITTDASNPTSPVLSGTPTFNGSIAILFDVDVAGVGLDGGFFNAVGGTAITAFGRDGSLIGAVMNTELGIEFLGLVTDDGTAQIAGLLFSLVGSEPFGYAIDNVRFGIQGQVVVPGGEVPEPAALALFAVGLLGLRRLRRAS